MEIEKRKALCSGRWHIATQDKGAEQGPLHYSGLNPRSLSMRYEATCLLSKITQRKEHRGRMRAGASLSSSCRCVAQERPNYLADATPPARFEGHGLWFARPRPWALRLQLKQLQDPLGWSADAGLQVAVLGRSCSLKKKGGGGPRRETPRVLPVDSTKTWTSPPAKTETSPTRLRLNPHARATPDPTPALRLRTRRLHHAFHLIRLRTPGRGLGGGAVRGGWGELRVLPRSRPGPTPRGAPSRRTRPRLPRRTVRPAQQEFSRCVMGCVNPFSERGCTSRSSFGRGGNKNRARAVKC